MRRHRLVLSLVVAAACYTSPKPEHYPPANTPNGVRGEIELQNGRRVDAELLEVRDSAYVVLVGERVGIAPYWAIRSASFAHQDWVGAGRFRSPNASTRERLRYASRFPFGIGDAALAALFRVGGQTAPDYLALASR